MIAVAAFSATSNPAPLRFVAFDIGQGDALLVETGRSTTLIDTGGSPGSSYDPGVSLLAPALRARGVTQLDAIAITHMHADHVGGLVGVLSEMPAAEIWIPDVAVAINDGRLAAARPDQQVRALASGYSRHRGACTWQVMHPPATESPTALPADANDNSLVMSLACGNRRVLLTGDSENAAEQRYAARLAPAPGTVLKSPHHGSRTSSGASLLDAATSRHVVISVGWRNRFGHPDAKVLERYRSRGMAVYRTDRDGAVTLTLGPRIRARGERWTSGRGRWRKGGWLQHP